MYLNQYNDNLYLLLLKELESNLQLTENYIEEIIKSESINQLEGLAELYEEIFSNYLILHHIDFAITRTHKLLYFKEVAFDRSNSYYHLKLIIKSPELHWLDEIYGGILSRVLKYFKALFSKIDNTFANTNVKQREVYQNLINNARIEINKLLIIKKEKEEINSERRRLKTQYLERIPFNGLFHMTHVSNLGGILEYGIFSHSIARNQNLMKRDISNPEINAKRKRTESIYNYKIHEYAPLYINPKNPMMEARCKNETLREEIILIKVSPNILVNQSVLFTDGNAAEESSNFYNNIEDFNKLDWSCLHDEYYFNHRDGRRVRCSEVLVYKQIALPYIDELVSFNGKPFEQLFKLFPNHAGIKLSVDRTVFF